jgi:hypothetical protein
MRRLNGQNQAPRVDRPNKLQRACCRAEPDEISGNERVTEPPLVKPAK